MINGSVKNTFGKYEEAVPLKDRIKILNNLYDSGHTINLFTARWSTTNKDWRILTEKQLKNWGVKYHDLRMGKPEADIFVDDKGVNANLFF